MKLLMKILLTFFICGKIILVSAFIYQTEFVSLFFGTTVMASETRIASETENKPALSSEEVFVGTEESVTSDRTDIKKISNSEYLTRKAELQEKEKNLEKREQQLAAIEKELDKKIAELTGIRDEIREKIRNEAAQKKAGEEKKIKHLIKVYSSMKPQKVASLIEKLDINLVIEIFSRMKGDTVGPILSSVDIEKGAKISEGLLKKEKQ